MTVEVALSYVRKKYPVFPCHPGKKSPLIPEGFKGATTDIETIENWWKKFPNAMVGLPTGDRTNVFVLDIDERDDYSGNQTLAELEQTHGKLPETFEVFTPSGGRHKYFGNVIGLKNSAGKVGKGLDIRANGGYVIAAGSFTSSGTDYQRANRKPVAEAPEWLIKLAKNETKALTTVAFVTAQDRYADKAFKDAIGTVMTAPEGQRNDTLNKQAFGIFGLVKAGRLNEDIVRQALANAALGCGLDTEEIEKTLDSAYENAVARNEGINKEKSNHPSTSGSTGKTQTTNGEKISLADFRAHMPDHRYIFIPTRDLWPAASVDSSIQWPYGLNGKKMKPSRWLDANQSVEQMTWAPGLPLLIENKLIDTGGWIVHYGCTCFNQYRKPTLRHGDANQAGPWLEHLAKVYPDDVEHITRWLAHRVQHPEQKLNHALVLGGKHGIGKDTILEPVKMAVGPWNTHEVSPGAMLGRFNGFVKSVILRVSEARDLGDVDRFAFYDHTKALIAAPPDVIRVDEKNVREYPVPNLCGVVITTNHKSDGLYLPADDRRHYVAWSDLSREEFDTDYWNRLWQWYGNGGIGHVAAYLANLDLFGFDPKAPPAKTEAFWHIVNAARPPEESELADILDKLRWPDAITLADLVSRARMEHPGFADWLSDRRHRRQIPHRLESAGYENVRNPAAKEGQWAINGKRQNVYAKTTLSIKERHAAANRLSQCNR